MPLYNFDVQGWASASGNLSAGGQFQLGRFAADPTLAIGAGSMYYNTTTNAIYYHDGLNWNEVSGSGSNVWQRISGVLSPIYDGDVIAASSGATTVATFTSLSMSMRASGGLTSYMSVGYDGTSNCRAARDSRLNRVIYRRRLADSAGLKTTLPIPNSSTMQTGPGTAEQRHLSQIPRT
jgi:hypothetical protein